MSEEISIVEEYPSSALTGAKFPIKLWRLVNDCQSGAISWGPFGKTVLIDFLMFEREFLDCARPMFKTKNMASFIRQLNLYGFRKLVSHRMLYTDEPSRVSTIHEFLHENFRLGRPDLLSDVKRRTLPVKLDCSPLPNPILDDCRKTFDETLVKSTECFNYFWDTSAHKILANGEQVVDAMYQIQVIPAITIKFENEKVTAVLENKDPICRLINTDPKNPVDDGSKIKPPTKTETASDSTVIPSRCLADFFSNKLEELHYEDEEISPANVNATNNKMEPQQTPLVATGQQSADAMMLPEAHDDLPDEAALSMEIDDNFYKSFIRSFRLENEQEICD